MIECTWCDILFYTYRLDWVMAAWGCILFLVVLTMIFLVYNNCGIASVFLLPHIACCITILLYVDAFMDLFGGNKWYSYEGQGAADFHYNRVGLGSNATV